MWFNNLAQTKCSNGNSNFLEFSRNYNSKHKTERSFSPLHQHDRKFFFDVYVYISALVTQKNGEHFKDCFDEETLQSLRSSFQVSGITPQNDICRKYWKLSSVCGLSQR